MYFFLFISAFILSIFFSVVIRHLALRWKIVDNPKTAERKIHRTPTPLLGGFAIFFSYFIVLAILAVGTEKLWIGYIAPKQLVAMFIASLILMIGGYLDDKYNLKAFYQTASPSLAALVLVLGGITIPFITNPFGGIINLATFSHGFTFFNFVYTFRFPADILTLAWLSGMMYTTKLLDGIDGLVASVTSVGALVIAAFALVTRYYQPDVAMLAVILAGASAGFLMLNRHPAKIFLGEGGSLLTGMLLGAIAIISGGKIATTLFVMGVPFLDMIWVMMRRLLWEHRSITSADDRHLHFRLLKIGLSQNQIVILFNVIPALFGVISLYIQSKSKLFLLGLLVAFMIILGAATVFMYKRRRRHSV